MQSDLQDQIERGIAAMNDIPARASAVIIGAGIVGNSLAYHLARLGWRELVLVDKGPMPNPGGSTGHASNFIFPIEYSKMMMELTRDSTEQYKELGVFTESGGIEVARTRSADDRAAPALHRGQGLGHPGPADRRRARWASWCRTSTSRSSSAARTSRRSASSTRCGPAR